MPGYDELLRPSQVGTEGHFRRLGLARLAGRRLAWSGGFAGPEQRSCMVATHRLPEIPALADRAAEAGDCTGTMASARREMP